MSKEVRIKYVNMVPSTIIKQEIQDVEEEEEVIPCFLCVKEFASEAARNNHVRMEHTNAFLQEPDKYQAQQVQVEPVPVKMFKASAPAPSANKHSAVQEEQQTIVGSLAEVIKEREQALFSSLRPSSLASLASRDVEYILVKTEDCEDVLEERKKKKVDSGKEVVRRQRSTKGSKDPTPIAGPFECLQPSNLVNEGVCHQIFFSCCEYSIHFRDEHTRRKSGNRCQVCEKPLLGGEGLDAPFNCMVCGAGFLSNKDLQTHTATNHVKLKPFECKQCLKRFTQASGLQQHTRMHTGDRPFSCTYCEKAFTQKSGLDQHLRIHTKVKPYRCVICSKAFAQSVHVKQHMRTHTNVSPFQCGICEKRFKQSSHLNYHLKNHNTFNMTDEQKQKYEQLIKEYNVQTDKPPGEVRRRPKINKVVVLRRENGELVTLQPDQYQYVDGQYTEITSETVTDESQDCEEVMEQSEQDHQEQLLAEQSIQVEEETYILDDDGDQTWEVEEEVVSE